MRDEEERLGWSVVKREVHDGQAVSASARCLRDGHVRVADVAFEMGFASVDGYQRAFLREFGCSPLEYAMSPVPLYLFVPYGVCARYQQRRSTMEKDKTNRDVATVFVQAQERPARKAIIKRGIAAQDYWSYCEEVGCDVWGLLTSMGSIMGEPVCLWLPPAMIEPGTSEYVQGVEVAPDRDGMLPEGLDVIDLPAATYLRFQGEPFVEEDYEQDIDQVWQAMDRYDPRSWAMPGTTSTPASSSSPEESGATSSCGWSDPAKARGVWLNRMPWGAGYQMGTNETVGLANLGRGMGSRRTGGRAHGFTRRVGVVRAPKRSSQAHSSMEE